MSTKISRQPVPPLRVLSILLFAVVLLAPALAAQRLIPFQGRVVGGDGQPLPDGVYRVTFAIYDSQTGGGALNGWIESHENVSIIGGQINVLLGSLTSLDDPNNDSNTSDAISFAGSGSNPVGPRYLGIKIGEATNQEMVPRHELVPTFHARMADRVARGGITTDQLADGAVTTVKLDPSAGLPVGGVVMWWGGLAEIPEGFEICDGTLPTTPGALLTGPKPDLRDRMPFGVGGTVAPALGVTGGSNATVGAAVTLTVDQMPSHTHTGGRHNHEVVESDPTTLSHSARQCTTALETAPPDPGTQDGTTNELIFGRRFVVANSFANRVTCPRWTTEYQDIDDDPFPPTLFPQVSSEPLNHTGGDQSHAHARELPAYIGMHFIIRVK